MNPEDEAYIRQTVEQWMKNSGYKSSSDYLVDSAQSRIRELEARLRLANETIRNANERIEELKYYKNSNPNFGAFGLDPNTAFIGLSEGEIQTVLQSTYRLRAKLNHPDKGGETENMRNINIAYQRLREPNTRGNYRK